MLIIYLALAGALGALARWGFSGLCLRVLGQSFPFGTLGENLLGCFLIGVVMELAEQFATIPAEWRTVIAVGFIGTFTTFSTFEFETYRLVRRGDFIFAAINLAVNVVIGFMLVWLGTGVTAYYMRLRGR